MVASDFESGQVFAESERLFIQAVLLRGDPARRAWETWRPGKDLGRLAHTYTILSPLLYHSLADMGVDDGWMPRLKGNHRQSWLRNQGLVRELGTILESLGTLGRRVVVTGPLPLAARFYPDLGSRVCLQLTFVLPLEMAGDMHNALLREGYRSAVGPVVRFPDVWLSVRQFMDYRHPDRATLRLRWRTGHPGIPAAVQNGMLDASVSLEFGDHEALTLCPTDSLFAACLSSVWHDHGNRLGRIADAFMVLQTTGTEIDWNRLITRAGEFESALPVLSVISFMHDHLEGEVPESALASLRELPVTEAQVARQRLQWGKPSALNRFRALRQEYRDCHTAEDGSKALGSILGFLRARWQEPVWRHLLRCPG